MFSASRNSKALPIDEHALDFLAATGCDFVRLPTDYRLWTRDVEHGRPSTKYEAFLHGYRVDRALLDLMLASKVA